MPPSELRLALASFDWDRAVILVERDPRLAKIWTHRLGFYEGLYDSEVLPLSMKPALERLRGRLL
jgi:hypothetical protein